MILDVFPSYKDKDMVDLLYQFERATGSSLNILVEKYLEHLLYEKGYLTVDVVNENEAYSEDKDLFTIQKQSKGIRIFCGELDFSSHSPEHIDEILNRLEKCTHEELIELSVNNYEKPRNTYKSFLYPKLDLTSLLPPKPENRFIYSHKKHNTHYIKKDNVRFGSHNSLEKAKEVRDFLIQKKWDKKYSSKETGLKGELYRKWLYSEMEKEQNTPKEE